MTTTESPDLRIEQARWLTDAPVGMTTSERRLAYLGQTHRRTLTPKQRRRLAKKDFHEQVTSTPTSSPRTDPDADVTAHTT